MTLFVLLAAQFLSAKRRSRNFNGPYFSAPASEGAELSLTQRKRAKHQWLRNCAEIPEHSVEGNINVPSVSKTFVK